MNARFVLFYMFLCFAVLSCSSIKKNVQKPTVITPIASQLTEKGIVDSEPKNDKALEILPVEYQSIPDSTFVSLKAYSSNFVYDMKYATDENFLKTQVYDCSECYLRLKTVKALIKANERFITKGYRIKIFDCYRPLDVQKKMWSIVSNPDYVADPKKGSIHNRGGAVDITLVDSNGKELDMGTPFDFFGIESSHDYEKLSEEVKSNRKLLRNGMIHANFRIFESEWWHYNLKNARKESLSNFKWKCD